MSDVLLKLGDFEFSVSTAAYKSLTKKNGYTHAEVKRIGTAPEVQFTGLDAVKITLEGVVYPHYRGAGTGQIDELRDLAATGDPHQLVAGNGKVLGRWGITGISETESHHLSDGTPLKQEFSMELVKYE